ncbi:MAG: ribosomal protein S18-alanine N-acetyltransferase [Cyanobacteria bacterium J06639_14]
MISLRYRPLTALDLPTILILDQACFGGLWSEAGYQRELDSPNSDLLGLEANSDTEKSAEIVGIGCLWAILDEAHITLLGIDPQHRCQGLGQWFLLQLLNHGCERGLTHATLEVRQSNQQAQALYAKFGFRVAGERRRYYADGENALILWRSGLQDTAFREAWQDWMSQLTHKLSQHNWQVAE